MKPDAHSSPQTALRGWRARAWAWVLFIALLKGLVPHAALAAMNAGSDPTAVLCTPALATGVIDVQAEHAASQMAGHAHCLCASGDAATLPPLVFMALALPATNLENPAAIRAAFVSNTRPLPPSRGPPR
jgi:hypothetical protein